MTDQHITDLVIVGCSALGLIAFFSLVMLPALTSYRRLWERAIVVVLSAYVLAAFAGVGVIIGAVIVYEWPRLF